jgi:hypothetical protein
MLSVASSGASQPNSSSNLILFLLKKQGSRSPDPSVVSSIYFCSTPSIARIRKLEATFPVKIKRDLENQISDLLKNLGRVIGRAKFNGFAARAAELIDDHPELVAVVGPLLKAREAIEKQTHDLDRKVLKLARHDAHRHLADVGDVRFPCRLSGRCGRPCWPNFVRAGAGPQNVAPFYSARGQGPRPGLGAPVTNRHAQRFSYCRPCKPSSTSTYAVLSYSL